MRGKKNQLSCFDIIMSYCVNSSCVIDHREVINSSVVTHSIEMATVKLMNAEWFIQGHNFVHSSANYGRGLLFLSFISLSYCL